MPRLIAADDTPPVVSSAKVAFAAPLQLASLPIDPRCIVNTATSRLTWAAFLDVDTPAPLVLSATIRRLPPVTSSLTVVDIVPATVIPLARTDADSIELAALAALAGPAAVTALTGVQAGAMLQGCVRMTNAVAQSSNWVCSEPSTVAPTTASAATSATMSLQCLSASLT